MLITLLLCVTKVSILDELIYKNQDLMTTHNWVVDKQNLPLQLFCKFLDEYLFWDDVLSAVADGNYHVSTRRFYMVCLSGSTLHW